MNRRNLQDEQEEWEYHQEVGLELLKRNKLEDAVKAFYKSISLKEDWNSYRALGKIFFSLKKFKQSADVFQKSILLKRNAYTYNDLGWALLFLGDYDESLNSFQKSIDLKEEWSPYQGLGLSSIKQGKYIDAIKALHNSIRLNQIPQSYNLLGLALYKLEKSQEALDAYYKAWSIQQGRDSIEPIISCLKNIYPNDYPILNSLLEQRRSSFLTGNVSGIPDLISNIIYSSSINPWVIWCYSKTFSLQSEPTYPAESINLTNPYQESNIEFALEGLITNKSEKKSLLSFGDSHGHLFCNLTQIKHQHVALATAFNINNPNSTSHAHNKIIKEIKEYNPEETILIFTLGEIDLREHVHKQSRLQGILPELIIGTIIDNYMQFIDRLLIKGYEICINGPHCGGGLGMSTTSLAERNDICDYMNQVLVKKCNDRGISCSSLYDIVVNSISRHNNLEFFFDQNHLHSPPSKKGKELQSLITRRLLKDKVHTRKSTVLDDKSKYQSSGERLDQSAESLTLICKILNSNIPGWFAFEKFLTSNYNTGHYPVINNSGFLLFELPFPILLKKIRLEFKVKYIEHLPKTFCYAIYEKCDPFTIANRNVLNGSEKSILKKDSSLAEIDFDFSKYKFKDMHTRYICLLIHNCVESSLTNISLWRMRYISE